MSDNLPDVMTPKQVREVLAARQLSSEEELMRAFGLTMKEADFVTRYVADPRSANTAFRAAFGQRRSPYRNGREMLQAAHIANAIAHEMNKLMERTHFTKERILNELGILAFSDVSNFIVKEDGTLGLAPGVPEHALRAVQSVKRRITRKRDEDGEVTEYVELEIKLWSKTEALKLAGQHLGIYTNNVNVSGSIDVNVRQVWEFGGRTIEFQ